MCVCVSVGRNVALISNGHNILCRLENTTGLTCAREIMTGNADSYRRGFPDSEREDQQARPAADEDRHWFDENKPWN